MKKTSKVTEKNSPGIINRIIEQREGGTRNVPLKNL